MLPAEILQQARQLHIRTRRLVDGAFAGEYHSVYKGRGIEFAEVREYVAGDDVRAIDWNVTARVGRPFVKQYVEERELTAMLLLDVSASGLFSSTSRRKTRTGVEIAAALALSAIDNNDKAGLILFTDRVELFVPPRKGRNRALRLIRDMLAFEPRGRGTDIAAALEYLRKAIPRRSIAFLISDFFAADFERPLRLVRRRHDLAPICLIDPRDRELPAVGFVRLRDLETGEERLVDTDSPAVRARFAALRGEAAARRRRLFRALGVDFAEVPTERPWAGPLLRFFRRRERRLEEGR